VTDERRTLSDADISSRRSTLRALRAQAIGVSGGDAAKSLRRSAPAHDADGAPHPEAKDGAAAPTRDRD
jgi:hypothetical protein